MMIPVLIWSAISLWNRWEWEKENTVELCVDGEEVLALTRDVQEDTISFLKKLGNEGVSSMSVYWDGRESLDALWRRWNQLLPGKLSLIFRTRPEPFSMEEGPIAKKYPPGLFSRVTGFLCAGPYVWGYPNLDDTFQLLQYSKWRLPWVEFGCQKGLATLIRRFPKRVVRAHSVPAKDIVGMTEEKIVNRFRRGVRERGIRFLYIRFLPGLTMEKNLAYVRKLRINLQRNNFVMGRAMPRYTAMKKPIFQGPAWVYQFLALLAAILCPIIYFGRILKKPGNLSSPLKLSFLSLMTGLFVAALMSSPDFVLGFNRFRSVKLALSLPLIYGFFTLYPWKNVRNTFKEPITKGQLAFLFLGLMVMFLFLMRSGHDSFLGVSVLELKLRMFLEDFLGVRPRFKEFAIGHPFLWLGFYGISKNKKSEMDRIFILAGLIGQVSIINTFCHAHTPLNISLLRTFHGLWLGAIGGGVLIFGRIRLGRLKNIV